MNVVLPSRKYQLFFEHRPEYLYVYVSCKNVDLEIAERYWIDILTMVHQRKYRRVLVEKNIPQKLPPHDVFTLVAELSHSCSNIAIAIADRHFDPERAEFEEAVGTNRGMHIRVTGDPAFAERWLLNEGSNTFERENIGTLEHALAA